MVQLVQEFVISSMEEAKQLAELTDRIVANLETIQEDNSDLGELDGQAAAIVENLKAIGEDENFDQLEELERQTSVIATNLQNISEQGNDLEELERQTGVIATNLGCINSDENDFDELLEKTTQIVDNLEAAKDAEPAPAGNAG